MLVDKHRRRAIELAHDLKLLQIILPELEPTLSEPEWSTTLNRIDLLEQPSFELAFAALVQALDARPTVMTICRRLKLSNEESDSIIWLVEHQADLNQAPQLSLAALKRLLAHPLSARLIALQTADRIANSASLEPIDFCRDFLSRHSAEVIDPVPLLTGDDLIAMGFKPGPRFKTILDSIRDAQLNLVISSRDEAIELAKSLAQS
jgi:poly(A) polymerase